MGDVKSHPGLVPFQLESRLKRYIQITKLAYEMQKQGPEIVILSEIHPQYITFHGLFY